MPVWLNVYVHYYRASQTAEQRAAALASNAARQRERRWARQQISIHVLHYHVTTLQKPCNHRASQFIVLRSSWFFTVHRSSQFIVQQCCLPATVSNAVYYNSTHANWWTTDMKSLHYSCRVTQILLLIFLCVLMQGFMHAQSQWLFFLQQASCLQTLHTVTVTATLHTVTVTVTATLHTYCFVSLAFVQQEP